MSLTCDELTDLNRRQNASPPHFERDEEPEAIRAGGLLELGVARRPRNMVIVWVGHVQYEVINYTWLPCFILFQSNVEMIG